MENDSADARGPKARRGKTSPENQELGKQAIRRFGKNLKAWRSAKGLSQEALGELAEVHMTEISRLERGARAPNLLTMARLANGLQIDLRVLVEGIPDSGGEDAPTPGSST